MMIISLPFIFITFACNTFVNIRNYPETLKCFRESDQVIYSSVLCSELTFSSINNASNYRANVVKENISQASDSIRHKMLMKFITYAI